MAGDEGLGGLDWADRLHELANGGPDWAQVLQVVCRSVSADGAAITVFEGPVALVNERFGTTQGHQHVGVDNDGVHQVSLTCIRTTAPFEPTAATRVDRLAGQVAHALRLDRTRRATTGLAGDLRQALTRLPIGAIIVSPDLDIRIQTEGASRLLERHDGLFVAPADPTRRGLRPELESLIIADSRADTDIRAAIRLMLQSGSVDQHVVSVPRNKGRPYGLLVARLGPPTPSASFLIILSDPDAPAELRPETLRRLYRLTPAESRLCAALADGDTLKSYATAEGVSLETVRSQLKQAMIKTNTHKQAQLVRLLVTGPAAYGS